MRFQTIEAVNGLVLLAATALTAPAIAQSGPLLGPAAFGDWHADKPGVSRLIKPADLPKPGATPSSANVSHVVQRPRSAMPQVPAGFKIDLLAEGLSGPRQMRVAPNGDIFIAETRAGRIRILRAADGSSKPSANEIYASGLRQPFGIGFFPSNDPQWVYVANTDSVMRFPYKAGDLKATAKPETVVAELPHGYGHSTRDIAFTPDNKRMLISVGSASNDAEGMPTAPKGLPAWSANHALGASWGS
jgi:glucose/arabinose dehydrogenase